MAKITTVLFDLDGTLVPLMQEDFIKAYFGNLLKRFLPYGYNKDQFVAAIWQGTKEMLRNDGSRTNNDAFWETFSRLIGEDILQRVEEFEDFYRTGFHEIAAHLPAQRSVRGVLDTLKDMGLELVLATNPIFPLVASASRLSWLDASLEDFIYVTSMENSHYSKPNLDYYREIFEKIGRKPEECIMVGNNPADDMCAAQLGCAVYLLPAYLENEQGLDISLYPQGTLAELPEYIASLG